MYGTHHILVYAMMLIHKAKTKTLQRTTKLLVGGRERNKYISTPQNWNWRSSDKDNKYSSNTTKFKGLWM